MVEIREKCFVEIFTISLSEKESDALCLFHYILSMRDENLTNQTVGSTLDTYDKETSNQGRGATLRLGEGAPLVPQY